MKYRIPTAEEYASYKGAHCHNLWSDVGPNWICPGCNRTKYEILRWTKRFPGTPHSFSDWMAGLHRHHDHAIKYTPQTEISRFSETIICDQCNAANGTAKRVLKLPEDFSFSPQEIQQFIIVKPHSKHAINKAKALELYTAAINERAQK